MKKPFLAALLFALVAVFGFAGPASAQAVDCDINSPTYYDPGGGVCPNDIDRPPAVQPTSALPRTGSNDTLPLAKTAIVLIGVGSALTVMAGRKRRHHVPA